MSIDTISPENKRKYRAPVHYAEVEVSLSDFNDDDILEYVRVNGLSDEFGAGSDSEEIARIDTLLLCGQRDAAREAVERMLSRTLGRTVQL